MSSKLIIQILYLFHFLSQLFALIYWLATPLIGSDADALNYALLGIVWGCTSFLLILALFVFYQVSRQKYGVWFYVGVICTFCSAIFLLYGALVVWSFSQE